MLHDGVKVLTLTVFRVLQVLKSSTGVESRSVYSKSYSMKVPQVRTAGQHDS